MAAELREEQWSLTDDAGNEFLFGEGTRFRLAPSLDFGSGEWRVQDVPRPQFDGDMVGRDTLSGPELQFTFQVRDGLNVWPHIDEFKQVWRADKVRARPGALSVLRYRQHGITYRYLGRGRKFDPVPVDLKNDRRQKVTATFKLADPERYIEPDDGFARSLTLRLIEAASDGGIVWGPDLSWPIELRPTSQARVGEVTVGGYRPAPFTCRIYGPVEGVLSKISISGDGWSIQTSATLKPGEVLETDTAANTITKNGVPQPGTLSRTSRLTARLQRGHQFLQFAGTDPSNTAYAEFTWYDTAPA